MPEFLPQPVDPEILHQVTENLSKGMTALLHDVEREHGLAITTAALLGVVSAMTSWCEATVGMTLDDVMSRQARANSRLF